MQEVVPGTTVEAVEFQAPTAEQIHAVLDERDVDRGSNLIEVLQRVQDELGYLPAESLREISRRTRVPLSSVYGVVSFYAQFYTEPRGKHTVRCCTGTACHVKGGGRVLDSLSRELGVEAGQSTPDMKFYLETVACLGTCFLAPVMMIDQAYFGDLTPTRVQSILDGYRQGDS